MKYTPSFLLATVAAMALAACGPRRSDNTGGSETGATGGAYDTTSTTPTTSDTGLKSSTDTTRMSTDTANTSADSARH